MQPSDTAYPRFKSRPSPAELERFYTPTQEEQAYGALAARAPTTRLGFLLLLKSFQRLGYFVLSSHIPQVIAEHIATAIGRHIDREDLRRYDESQARRKHLAAVRKFLDVKPFTAAGKALLHEAVNDAAMTKEDVADIVNVGIEMLVRSRYELPAFDTLVRQARAGRAAANQTLYRQAHGSLGQAGEVFLDALFVVGDNPRRVSPWNDLKEDPVKPTVHGMRELLARFEQLSALSRYNAILNRFRSSRSANGPWRAMRWTLPAWLTWPPPNGTLQAACLPGLFWIESELLPNTLGSVFTTIA